MPPGIALALLAYGSLAWGDALVKALGAGTGPSLSVFEITFYTTLVAGFFLLPARDSGERWRDFWRLKRPYAVHLRSLLSAGATLLGVAAFTTIPLAEAYALIFLAPLFVTLLSALVLREEVGIWRWSAVLLGFGGVLLVVRPGFKALETGHFAALAVALLAAITVIQLRALANDEKRVSLLGMHVLYGLAVNGLFIVASGVLTIPDMRQTLFIVLTGACIGIGQFCLLSAMRLSAANQIAPTHYSQIGWAVVIGALFFGEVPDLLTIAGLVVLAAAGLLTVMREIVRLGRARFNPLGRNRL